MRTTDDKKDNVIRIRVNDTLNNHMHRVSARTGKSVSQYIRDLISRDMIQTNSVK